MPKYFDLRGIPKILAVFAVSSLLTIASGANLNFAGGFANGVLFLDGSKNASSTSRILMDGNAGVVTSTRFVTGVGTNSAPSISFLGEQDTGFYLDTAGSVSVVADTARTLVVRPNIVYFSAQALPFTAAAGNIGTNAIPFGQFYASSSAASLLPAITSSGTLRIANQGGPTTTIDLTGRLCIKALDMVAGTQRYLTIASGSLVITTTDCR